MQNLQKLELRTLELFPSILFALAECPNINASYGCSGIAVTICHG